MIAIGGRRRGDFGALGAVDGGEKMRASGTAGIFAADFHFVAGLALKAQENFDGLSDVMAVDFDGRWRSRCGLLRDQRTRERKAAKAARHAMSSRVTIRFDTLRERIRTEYSATARLSLRAIEFMPEPFEAQGRLKLRPLKGGAVT